MSIKVNGGDPIWGATFNGVELDEVYFNGVKVFSKDGAAVIQASATSLNNIPMDSVNGIATPLKILPGDGVYVREV